MWSLILQQTVPGLFSWQWLGLKKESRSTQCLWRLGSELAHCGFHHIPLAIAHQEANPDSRDGEIDSTSWWEELWGHNIKDMNTEKDRESGPKSDSIMRNKRQDYIGPNLGRILTIVSLIWRTEKYVLGIYITCSILWNLDHWQHMTPNKVT